MEVGSSFDLASMRVVVIGGGKMGEAIVAGWSESGEPGDSLQSRNITVVEPNDARREALVSGDRNRALLWHGISLVSDASEVAATPDMVVLAVKPQVMSKVLASVCETAALGGAVGESGDGPLFVSIAAGLETEKLEAGLPEGARLVRVMPNMPLAIGAGASGVCGGARATEADVQLVAGLFGSLGRSVVVDESDMDAVCAISGSGPAYVAAMIEALRDAGASQGLDPHLAETLALQTVLGTARLIDEGDQTVGEVRESICSPGGTTLAALDAMNAEGFNDVFYAGVAAAVKRSKELAQCS